MTTWNGFQQFPHGKSNFSKKSNLKATDWYGQDDDDDDDDDDEE